MTKLLPVPRRFRFWAIRESKRIAWGLFLLVCLVICIDSFGFVKFYFERDFETEFNYPLNVPNFPELVKSFGKGEQVNIHPINQNYSRIQFLDNENAKCVEEDPIGLLVLVKSAPNYFDKRAVIRATWGHPSYLQNISRSISHMSPLISCLQQEAGRNKRSFDPLLKPVFQIKLVFLIGQQNDESASARNVLPTTTTTTTPLPSDILLAQLDNSIESQLLKNNDDDNSRKDKAPSQTISALLQHSQAKKRLTKDGNNFDKIYNFRASSIEDEILKHNDIVRAEFIDSYINNTFKTMMGIRFAVEKCSNFQFVFLVDDDMHINMKNLVRYLEYPREYPFVSNNVNLNSNEERVHKKTHCNTLAATNLYAGKVLTTTRPVRYKLVSKWYLSLEEWKYNLFPPYLPAAAILMSKSVVQDFYFASFYTEHFRFDDVYLGLLAYKMNITPTNSNYFYVCHSPNGRCPDSSADSGHSVLTANSYEDPMKYVIARHGLNSVEELYSFWQEQKTSGNLDL